LRIKGFKDQVATYPDLQLVASQPGNWDRLTALNATSNILRQNPDLVGIYANNDGTALRVFEAVKNANAVGKALVVGTDGIREAKKSVQAGERARLWQNFPSRKGN
jgi:ribose transport system substrate-binding protein